MYIHYCNFERLKNKYINRHLTFLVFFLRNFIETHKILLQNSETKYLQVFYRYKWAFTVLSFYPQKYVRFSVSSLLVLGLKNSLRCIFIVVLSRNNRRKGHLCSYVCISDTLKLGFIIKVISNYIYRTRFAIYLRKIKSLTTVNDTKEITQCGNLALWDILRHLIDLQ